MSFISFVQKHHTMLLQWAQWISILVGVSYFLFPYFPNTSIEVLGKNIFITQPLMLFGVILWGSVLLLALFSEKREAVWRHGIILAPLGIALVMFLISTLVSYGISISKLFSVAAIGIIVTLFAFFEKRYIDRMMDISAVVVTAASVLGILQFYVFGDMAAPAAYLGFSEHTYYASGFANYPSLFGASLAVFVPLFFGLAIVRYRGRTRLWYTALLTSVAALILTIGRSAILGAIGGVGFMGFAYTFFMRERRIPRGEMKRGMALVAGVAIVVSLFTPPDALQVDIAARRYERPIVLLGERFSFLDVEPSHVFSLWRSDPLSHLAPSSEGTTEKTSSAAENGSDGVFTITDGSARSRIMLYTVGITMLTHSPYHFVFGWGIGAYRDHWTKFAPPHAPEGRVFGPHSTYIEAAVSGGMIGLGTLLAFFVVLYATAWRLRDMELLILPLMAGVLGILIDGFFHTHLYTKYLWIFVGLLMALIWQYQPFRTHSLLPQRSGLKPSLRRMKQALTDQR